MNCGRAPASCLAWALLLVGLGDLDVDRGEKGEDVGLDGRDHDLDHVDDEQDEHPHDRGARLRHGGGGEGRQHRLEEERGQDGEGAHDDVAGEEVAEQTNGKCDQAQDGGEDLDEPDHGVEREGDAGGGEALGVAQGAVLLNAADDEVHEELEAMAKQYQMNVEDIEGFMGDAEKDSIKKDLAVKKAVKVVVDNAKEV